jgi:hypothetical protein
MHVKYRQDNLYCITWYTSTCDSNGHELTIRVTFMIKCMCYTRLQIYWFSVHSATIPNDSVTIGRMLLIGVGHSRSDSIVPLMLRTVCCAMIGVLALYYRSLEIALTLLRIGNISGRPYCWTMTVIYIICIYQLLYIYHI